MPRAILASALLTRLRQMTDTVNNTHLTDAEGYAVLTSAVADTWDKILASGGSDRYTKSASFSTVAGTKTYDLDTICTADDDFYKVDAIYVNEGNGLLRPITRIAPFEELAYRAPSTVTPMVLYYIPCAPVWSTGAESFNGINGWEEHTLVTAAMTVQIKRGDDYSPFARRKGELEQRMATAVNVSNAEPSRVVKKRRSRYDDRYLAWSNSVSNYDVRGSNLELFYRYGGGE